MLRAKVGGIYKITVGEFYYIGMSIDIFCRFGSHITDLYMNKHSSPKLQQIFLEKPLSDFKFEILETVSKTKMKEDTRLKGKAFETHYRKILLKKEKEWMSKYSIHFSLNANNRHFSI